MFHTPQHSPIKFHHPEKSTILSSQPITTRHVTQPPLSPAGTISKIIRRSLRSTILSQLQQQKTTQHSIHNIHSTRFLSVFPFPYKNPKPLIYCSYDYYSSFQHCDAMEREQEQEEEALHSQLSITTLPPGCRFHPSEQLLLRYYLANKNNTTGNRNGSESFNGSDLIREVDLYGYDPFELPESACFAYGCGGRNRHWYCFTGVARVSRRRKARSGFWIRKGSVRNVNGGGGNVVLGTRKRFVFYLGESRRSAVRTNWVLYEYALVDHLVASFVVCRIFAKPSCKNSVSDIGLSCCAEESVSAVRHIGIQHDEHVTSDVVEAKVCGDSSIDRKNEISVHPQRCATENNDHQVMNTNVSLATFQHSVGTQGSQQLSIANFYISNNLTSLVRNGAISIGSQLAFYLLCKLQLLLFYLQNFTTHSCDHLS